MPALDGTVTRVCLLVFAGSDGTADGNDNVTSCAGQDATRSDNVTSCETANGEPCVLASEEPGSDTQNVSVEWLAPNNTSCYVFR